MEEKIESFYDAYRLFVAQFKGVDNQTYVDETNRTILPQGLILIKTWTREWKLHNEKDAAVIEEVVSRQREVLENKDSRTEDDIVNLIYEIALKSPRFESGEFQQAVKNRGIYVTRKMSEALKNRGKNHEAELLTQFADEQEFSASKGPEKK